MITKEINKGKLELWHLNKHIKHIRSMLMEFEDFKVSHVHKEANKVTDKLANMGVNAVLEIQNEIF